MEHARPKTIVYIDGFNLYYRALKETVYKWLDLGALFQELLPRNDIIGIKYFTANISAHVDPEAPQRQQVYLDALGTIPHLTIHKGNFMTSEKFAAVVSGASGAPYFRPRSSHCEIDPPPVLVKILKVEEKASDVNLATHLVFDGCRERYEAAVVATNDTDLVEPIKVVTSELGLPVGVACPAATIADSLKEVSTFHRHIRPTHLARAQFPDPLTTPTGVLTKPLGW